MSYGRRQGGSYEGRRGHGKGFKRCAVEMGKEYEVDITETSPQGEGIARIQGFVVRVANAKLGDHVKIKITRIGGMTAKADVIKYAFSLKNPSLSTPATLAALFVDCLGIPQIL